MRIRSTNRYRQAIVLVAAAAMLLVTAVVPAAANDAPGTTYLALGDSVAAGTQAPEPFTSNGYADRLYRNIADDYGFDEFVNLGCPADDTSEMLDGDDGPDGGSLCYGDGAPFAAMPNFGADSQLDAALAYLTAHPGDVGLITITIGANDVLACSPLFEASCLVPKFGEIATNLTAILFALRSAAPGVPIVGMNYYNPNLALWITDPALAEAANTLMVPFNGTLEAVYAGFSVPVADVETAFKTFKTRGEVPQNVRTVCLYTRMCEKQGASYVFTDNDPAEEGVQTDIHPSTKGYRKIASVFGGLIDDLGLL
jgi:lysophospholipase L1-like esterase